MLRQGIAVYFVKQENIHVKCAGKIQIFYAQSKSRKIRNCLINC